MTKLLSLLTLLFFCTQTVTFADLSVATQEAPGLESKAETPAPKPPVPAPVVERNFIPTGEDVSPLGHAVVAEEKKEARPSPKPLGLPATGGIKPGKGGNESGGEKEGVVSGVLPSGEEPLPVVLPPSGTEPIPGGKPPVVITPPTPVILPNPNPIPTTIPPPGINPEDKDKNYINAVWQPKGVNWTTWDQLKSFLESCFTFSSQEATLGYGTAYAVPVDEDGSVILDGRPAHKYQLVEIVVMNQGKAGEYQRANILREIEVNFKSPRDGGVSYGEGTHEFSSGFPQSYMIIQDRSGTTWQIFRDGTIIRNFEVKTADGEIVKRTTYASFSTIGVGYPKGPDIVRARILTTFFARNAFEDGSLQENFYYVERGARFEVMNLNLEVGAEPHEGEVRYQNIVLVSKNANNAVTVLEYLAKVTNPDKFNYWFANTGQYFNSREGIGLFSEHPSSLSFGVHAASNMLSSMVPVALTQQNLLNNYFGYGSEYSDKIITGGSGLLGAYGGGPDVFPVTFSHGVVNRIFDGSFSVSGGSAHSGNFTMDIRDGSVTIKDIKYPVSVPVGNGVQATISKFGDGLYDYVLEIVDSQGRTIETYKGVRPMTIVDNVVRVLLPENEKRTIKMISLIGNLPFMQSSHQGVFIETFGPNGTSSDHYVVRAGKLELVGMANDLIEPDPALIGINRIIPSYREQIGANGERLIRVQAGKKIMEFVITRVNNVLEGTIKMYNVGETQPYEIHLFDPQANPPQYDRDSNNRATRIVVLTKKGRKLLITILDDDILVEG